METIITKYKTLNNALASLEESLDYFKAISTAPNKDQFIKDYVVVYKVARDSVIQRFEFSVELFWKYVRLYLEEIKQVKLESNTPRDVMRSACQSRVLSEDSAEAFMKMVRSRNLTSHTYKEEVAEQLVHDIPKYFEQMRLLAPVIKP